MGPPLLPFEAGGPLDQRIRGRGQHRLCAFTRAIWELFLPRDFKDILTPKWQAAMKRYEPAQVSRVSKSPRSQNRIPGPLAGRGKVRGKNSKPSPALPATRYGKFTIEADPPKPAREKLFKIGDRVRTSHGTATVVDVDKYLVDLDGQAAQLWEKAWGLRKA